MSKRPLGHMWWGNIDIAKGPGDWSLVIHRAHLLAVQAERHK